ncbi:MAG: 16S rRNA (uracil1498-N3)-methyltransferase, partial [Thermoproteota archaeon]
EKDHLILKANFDIDPPAQTPIILIIALPRPKMLRRIFRSISMLGVKEIYLINTYKVEKSFWHSNLLDPEKYEEYFTQGLSQSKDTILPKLHIRNKFKPFVEDELAAIIKKTNALVAHPGDYPAFPQGSSEPMSLAIGPEGGFTEYEIGKLQEAGFKAVHCGSRILRMETAVVSLISQHSSFLK